MGRAEKIQAFLHQQVTTVNRGKKRGVGSEEYTFPELYRYIRKKKDLAEL